LVAVAKKATDEEDFIAQVHRYNINISKNFLDSLYGTIKQKLPNKQEFEARPSTKP
jgi:hypothetical protein